MSKQQLTIWILIGAVIGIVIIYFSLKGIKNISSPSSNQNTNTANQSGTAPGLNVIGKEGLVLTPESKPTRNDVEPGSPEAPKQSLGLSDKEIPKDSLKLVITTGKITPSGFTVRAGSAVTLTISAGDNAAHIFRFRDSALQAIAAGVSPDETRAITFNAPTKKGEYEFYCDSLRHADLGERGVMIVK